MNLAYNCPLCGAPQYVENWCGDDREEPDYPKRLCSCEPLHSALGRKRNLPQRLDDSDSDGANSKDDQHHD